MRIRKMNISDIETVKKIYSESFEEVKGDISLSKDNIYVVCDCDNIFGLCMVDYIDDIFVKTRTAFVNIVCVAKEYRRSGIAVFMLNEIEKMVLEDGATGMMLTSNSKRVDANNLYKKLGFKIYDTNVFRKDLV